MITSFLFRNITLYEIYYIQNDKYYTIKNFTRIAVKNLPSTEQ